MIIEQNMAVYVPSLLQNPPLSLATEQKERLEFLIHITRIKQTQNTAILGEGRSILCYIFRLEKSQVYFLFFYALKMSQARGILVF